MRTGTYVSEDAALRRVEKLKTYGIWTGYRVYGDGSASLLYDPDMESEAARHDLKPVAADD